VVDFVGLTMVVEGRERTAVFTDVASPEIDQAQYDTGEGPCLAAFERAEVVTIESMTDDGPFPAFREAAAARGIASTLSLPLIVAGRCVGAMTLYSRLEDAFSPSEQEITSQFAAQAAIVLANAQAYRDAHDLGSHLADAMEHRAVIEQAKGILMGAQRCSADDAFALLVKASQRENVKVRDIAERIVSNAVARAPLASTGDRPPTATTHVPTDRDRTP
jgi:transcriptional regulator with GAF, ATPase, and Fis domain